MTNTDFDTRIEPKILRIPWSTCWYWMGSVKSTGYGRVTIMGRQQSAHKVVYKYYKGPVTAGLQLDHLCRVRCCVNPEHLEPVTQRENILRGLAPSAYAARVAHCPYGHPYSRENTGLYSGARHCKTCARERVRKRYYRVKSEQQLRNPKQGCVSQDAPVAQSDRASAF